MKNKKEHLAHFSIAGFSYYDGAEAFLSLKIGTPLTIELDSENKYDPRAVKISYKDFHLGYIPRSENRIFFKLLSVGFTGFELRVQSLDGSAHPEEQVQVVAHLVRK